MGYIVTALTSIFTSGLLTAGLIFLAKTWIGERIKSSIKHEYDLELEKHKVSLQSESTKEVERLKAQMQQETNKEVERLKAQLQIAATERSIRLSGTFDKMAETVATVYAKIVTLNEAALNLTAL